MEKDPARAFELHHLRKSHRGATSTQRTTSAHSDPARRAAGRLRSLPGEADCRRRGRGDGVDLRRRPRRARRWREAPLAPLGNDEWRGSFVVDACGRWTFTVAAWIDRVASWQDEVRRKL